MNFTKSLDIAINVIIPLLIGYLLYIFGGSIHLPGLIRHHAADGLWAYAFLNCLLILWNRRVKTAWLIIVFFVSINLELLQYINIVEGTADWIDIATYCLFFALSMILNMYLKLIYQNKIKLC